MNLSRKIELPLFFFIFALGIWGLYAVSDKTFVFQGDGQHYVQYAVSLHEHDIFGLVRDNPGDEYPFHGNANAPLYPLLIASVMAFDEKFADGLICYTHKGKDAGCEQHYTSFFIVQSAFALLALFLIYLIAYRLSQNRTISWLAAFLTLASGIFTEFSFIIMTEILILPAFTALLYACLLFYQKRSLSWVAAIGILLGILTLIRPSYLYLFYGFILFFISLTLIKRDRESFRNLILLVAVFVLTVSPWALRNKTHFDTYALTTGGYAEAILIQRTNYNQMSWAEVGVSFIYWLPDFGDSLAHSLFPEHLHNKLGWDEGTYYAEQYEDKVKLLSEELGGHDKILKHLITEEILTLKHITVSFPLAIRAVFISKYWGLLGFIATIALLISTVKRHDYSIVVIALPLFFMVDFHALLSVSIPRYNLPLVALYAFALSFYIHLYSSKIIGKFRNE